jgi:hypothetical protein
MDVLIEAAKLLLNVKKNLSIINGRFYFQAVANDARILTELFDFHLTETGNFSRIVFWSVAKNTSCAEFFPATVFCFYPDTFGSLCHSQGFSLI